MIRFNFTFFSIFFLIFSYSFSQSGTLKGRIIDGSNGESIPMVNITLLQDGSIISGASSDMDGYYTIKPIPPGKYTVEASFIGYQKTIVNNVLISPNKITAGNYELLPESTELGTVNIIESSVPLIDRDKSGAVKTKEQIKKNVWTSNDTGEKVKVIKSFSDNDEGKIIANSIFEKSQNEKTLFSDFAILYRTNAQSRSFEESLRKLNFPYKIYGGLSFYQRKEVKDLLAYFRLSSNLNDDESLKRIINYPKRGIGLTTLNKAIICSNENNISVFSVLENIGKYNLQINSGTHAKINLFVSSIKKYNSNIDSKDCYELALEIAKESGLLKELSIDKSPEGIVRFENIQELLNGIQEFSNQKRDNSISTLGDFLIDVALLTDTDNDDSNDKNRISLMTIHAAKGLEFPYVYIVGMEEDLFPSQLSKNSRSELEEERRLFYVALTRAKKSATLSYSVSRFRWGNTIGCEPSRFIEEIDPKFLDLGSYRQSSITTLNYHNSVPLKNNFSKNFKNIDLVNNKNVSENLHEKIENLNVGNKVYHERFGKGKIIELSGIFPNTKATVYFPSAGQKQLLLKFAKLQLISI